MGSGDFLLLRWQQILCSMAMIEWALYAQESYLGELGSIQKWASTFPLFHWGPIAWGFYIMLAVALDLCY